MLSGRVPVDDQEIQKNPPPGFVTFFLQESGEFHFEN